MNYRNAKYVNDQGLIDCEIEHPEYGWIPYALDPNDEDMTINNDELLAQMVENDDVTAYTPPTQEEMYEETAMQVRNQRDNQLKFVVDPVVSNPLRWNELTEEKRQQIADYRNELLNVPQQEGFPFDVTPPEKPDFL
jgi:hypothetical protein